MPFGRGKKKKKQSKIEVKLVTVSYGLLNNPDNKKIEKEIEKYMKKGFRLDSRIDEGAGIGSTIFTGGLARGRTKLTFIKGGEDE